MPIKYVEDIVIADAFEDASMGEYLPLLFDNEWQDLYELAWMMEDEYMERVAE